MPLRCITVINTSKAKIEVRTYLWTDRLRWVASFSECIEPATSGGCKQVMMIPMGRDQEAVQVEFDHLGERHLADCVVNGQTIMLTEKDWSIRSDPDVSHAQVTLNHLNHVACVCELLLSLLCMQ